MRALRKENRYIALASYWRHTWDPRHIKPRKIMADTRSEIHGLLRRLRVFQNKSICARRDNNRPMVKPVLENRAARADLSRTVDRLGKKTPTITRARARERERESAMCERLNEHSVFPSSSETWHGESFITGARDHHRQDRLLCNVIARFAVETANRPSVLPRTERPSEKKPMENRSCGRCSFGSARLGATRFPRPLRARESVVARYDNAR